MKTTRCRSCNKKVFFARDTKGKLQILDAIAPVYGLSPRDVDPTAIRANGETPGFMVNSVEFKFYVSHFATCPHATSHSKKGDQNARADEAARPKSA